jgi:uncharacterized membrane protein YgcG
MDDTMHSTAQTGCLDCDGNVAGKERRTDAETGTGTGGNIEKETGKEAGKKASQEAGLDLARWYQCPTSMTVTNWAKVGLGVAFVTFLCPALSNYALFRLTLGLQQTLTSLGPVYTVPVMVVMQVWKAAGTRAATVTTTVATAAAGNSNGNSNSNGNGSHKDDNSSGDNSSSESPSSGSVVTWRAVAGSALACTGVAVLCLS